MNFRKNIRPFCGLRMTKEEIKKIAWAKLPYRLEEDRQWMLMLYYATLNTSVISRPELTDQYLSYWCCKSGTFRIVPLHPIVRNILHKIPHIDYQPARIIDRIRRRKRFNRNIREIARLAGINTKVPVKVELKFRKVRKLFKLPEHRTIKVPKYRVLNAHTIRASSINNKHLCGMESSDIDLLGGRAFYRYYPKGSLHKAFTGEEKRRITELFHNEFFIL